MSPPELEVLGLLCLGFWAKEVAVRLGIGWRTAGSYRRVAYQTLHAVGPQAACAVARAPGQVPCPLVGCPGAAVRFPADAEAAT